MLMFFWSTHFLWYSCFKSEKYTLGAGALTIGEFFKIGMFRGVRLLLENGDLSCRVLLVLPLNVVIWPDYLLKFLGQLIGS